MTILTVPELLEKLKISRATMYKWIKLGLPRVKCGKSEGVVMASGPYDYCNNCIFRKDKNCTIHKVETADKGWCKDHAVNVLDPKWKETEAYKYRVAVEKAIREVRAEES